METKVTPTKLDVFNMGDKLSFDVNTPQFLKEACENNNGGMYAVCMLESSCASCREGYRVERHSS